MAPEQAGRPSFPGTLVAPQSRPRCQSAPEGGPAGVGLRVTSVTPAQQDPVELGSQGWPGAAVCSVPVGQ